MVKEVIKFIFVLFLVGLVSQTSFVSSYTFSGGNGSSVDPYQITNWTDLNATRLDLTAYYILTANLSSTDADYEGIGDNWTPIGSDFTGNFDGQGNTISDLIIYLPEVGSVGLFGGTNEGGVISNLGLVDANITGSGDVGGIAVSPNAINYS